MDPVLDVRFRRLWDCARLPQPSAFDCANDAHVEELACLLLERFLTQRDAEAFTLMFQLTGTRLERIARRLLDRHARAMEPTELVERVKRRLFVEGLVAPPKLVGSFLALARGLMEQELQSSRPHPTRGSGGD
jgi:hypothetical protein